MLSQHKRSEFTLTPQEVARIWQSLSNFQHRIIIKLLYWVALRRNELRTLHIEDINLEKERLLVRHGKGAKQRIVPIINPELISDLNVYIGKKATGILFPNPKGTYYSNRWIDKIVAKAGFISGIKHPNPNMTQLNPHLFRHSIARHLKTAGFTAEWIQKLLGHSSIETTMDEYGTLGIDEMQMIANRKLNLVPKNKVLDEKPRELLL